MYDGESSFRDEFKTLPILCVSGKVKETIAYRICGFGFRVCIIWPTGTIENGGESATVRLEHGRYVRVCGLTGGCVNVLEMDVALFLLKP